MIELHFWIFWNESFTAEYSSICGTLWDKSSKRWKHVYNDRIQRERSIYRGSGIQSRLAESFEPIYPIIRRGPYRRTPTPRVTRSGLIWPWPRVWSCLYTAPATLTSNTYCVFHDWDFSHRTVFSRLRNYWLS